MRAINTEFYGDDVRWFMGEVKAINDPDQLGRIQVRIFGIHSERTADVKDTDLPWANVVLPVTQGGTSLTTQATGIQIGAKVFGLFADGEHSQVPIVLGSIPHNPILKVNFNGPADTYVNVSGVDNQYKPGDRITDDINQRLYAAGIAGADVGTELTETQLAVLNESTAGSGDIPISLVGDSRHEQAFNYLKEKFQTRGHNNPAELAAAFVGNFMHEAGPALDPTEPGDNGNALGIAQWNGKTEGRYHDLVQYAKDNNGSEFSFALQLSFVIWELYNKEKWVWSYLSNTSTIDQCTEAVMALYERPDVSGKFRDAYPLRKSYAKYQRRGGISAVSTSGQNAAIAAYRSEYQERLADAKEILKEHGRS
jgi:hypothetical protein